MKKFTMIDESFVCNNCGKEVNPLVYTARDHCPFCLYSIHVDIYPGDRLCECKGSLKPVGIENGKKGYKIIYKCESCGEKRKNIVANDDNMDIIINLSAQPVET